MLIDQASCQAIGGEWNPAVTIGGQEYNFSAGNGWFPHVNSQHVVEPICVLDRGYTIARGTALIVGTILVINSSGFIRNEGTLAAAVVGNAGSGEIANDGVITNYNGSTFSIFSAGNGDALNLTFQYNCSPCQPGGPIPYSGNPYCVPSATTSPTTYTCTYSATASGPAKIVSQEGSTTYLSSQPFGGEGTWLNGGTMFIGTHWALGTLSLDGLVVNNGTMIISSGGNGGTGCLCEDGAYTFKNFGNLIDVGEEIGLNDGGQALGTFQNYGTINVINNGHWVGEDDVDNMGTIAFCGGEYSVNIVGNRPTNGPCTLEKVLPPGDYNVPSLPGVPEFPSQIAAVLVFTALLALSYFALTRRKKNRYRFSFRTILSLRKVLKKCGLWVHSIASLLTAGAIITTG